MKYKNLSTTGSQCASQKQEFEGFKRCLLLNDVGMDGPKSSHYP